MGIYGHRFDALIESKNKLQETNTISEQVFGFSSVAYDEYCNRCSLLESCTDDSSILEAQIEVLKEVSFKDIISKIGQKIKDAFEFVRKLIRSLIDKIKGFFNKHDKEKFDDMVDDIDDFWDDFEEDDIKDEYYYSIPMDLTKNIFKKDLLAFALPLYTEVYEKESGASSTKYVDKPESLSRTDREVEDFFKNQVKEEELKQFSEVINSKSDNDNKFIHKLWGSKFDKDDVKKSTDWLNSIYKELESLLHEISKKEAFFEKILKSQEQEIKYNNTNNSGFNYAVNSINRDLVNIRRLYSDLFKFSQSVFSAISSNDRTIERIWGKIDSSDKSENDSKEDNDNKSNESDKIPYEE